MNNYILKTAASMKPYNCHKWYIDRDIVREIRIAAESINDAFSQYREIVTERDYIQISKNALKK